MTETILEEVSIVKGVTFDVDLAALDARHVLHYSRRLLFFDCASSSQRDAQLVALKAGLKSLLQKCPVLGGIVAAPEITEPEDPLWRKIVPGPGIELVVKDLSEVMPSMAGLAEDDFASRHFEWDLLMPVPRDLNNTTPYPAFKVQFSTIKGGTILTFAMSHTISDGNGMDGLMRILAEEVSNAAADREITGFSMDRFVGMDRSPVRDVRSDISFNMQEHPAYRWRSPIPPQPPHPLTASRPELPLILKIPPARLKQLKLDATRPNAPPISTHDAIVALMWRSLVLIRSRRSVSRIDDTMKTNLFLPSDCRKQLGLSSHYVGNAVYQLTTQLDVETLFGPCGLKHAASALRAAITAATPGKVRSYFSLINGDASKACALGYAWEASTAADVAMGTCLNSGDVLYGSNWGHAFGAVQSFRMISGEGDNCIMPRLPDGSVEVVVSVTSNEVALLKSEECFGKYCA